MLLAMKRIVKSIVPSHVRSSVRRWFVRYTAIPPYKGVRFGSFRRVSPIHRGFETGRGLEIDRYYIEKFLASHSDAIRGHVLEFTNPTYARAFGGQRVTKTDVLDLRPNYPTATITADITVGESLPSDTFDCIICTQVLQLTYDVGAAIRTLHRMLKPSGVLLATFPGISQIAPEERDYCGDYWRFTRDSAERMFRENFSGEEFSLDVFGNVLSVVGFLHGLAAEEFRKAELDYCDPDYQFVLAVRAVKQSAPRT
jgi:SAM-dependent methyltransferase